MDGGVNRVCRGLTPEDPRGDVSVVKLVEGIGPSIFNFKHPEPKIRDQEFKIKDQDLKLRTRCLEVCVFGDSGRI